MKYLVFINAFLILCSISVLGQQSSSSGCISLNAIITQMQSWRTNNTAIMHPLSSRRQKPLIGRGLLTGSTRIYYSSSAVIQDEYASELGMDDEGHCSYTAYLGPYSKESIDNKGKRLKDLFLSCIDRVNWKIGDDPSTYLSISYNPVDVFVSITKMPIKNSDSYRLVVSMFRFTPLK